MHQGGARRCLSSPTHPRLTQGPLQLCGSGCFHGSSCTGFRRDVLRDAPGALLPIGHTEEGPGRGQNLRKELTLLQLRPIKEATGGVVGSSHLRSLPRHAQLRLRVRGKAASGAMAAPGRKPPGVMWPLCPPLNYATAPPPSYKG